MRLFFVVMLFMALMPWQPVLAATASPPVPILVAAVAAEASETDAALAAAAKADATIAVPAAAVTAEVSTPGEPTAPVAGDGIDEGFDIIATLIRGDGSSSLRNTLAGLFVVVMTLAIKWWRSSTVRRAESYEQQAKDMGQSAKQRVVSRVKGYLWRRAGEIQELELPELAAAVVSGRIKGDQVKMRLKALGDRLMEETLVYFERQDIDILAEFGRDQLSSWIRSAVDDISVFKKWPTAKVLLEGGAEAIMAVGLDRAGAYYDSLRQKVAAGVDTASKGAPQAAVVAKIDVALAEEFAAKGSA